MPAGPVIRPGRDGDADGIIALIWSCWSHYPGIRMDVDHEMPELRALASYYAGLGGQLWVAEDDGRVVGMIATQPCGAQGWEICKVYVDPALHGGGLGHALLDTAERHAMANGADRLFLFSDTRFDRAHRFYEKRCYVRQGPIRVLHDISNSLEFGYAKPVNGELVLDIAAATAAIIPLSSLLRACADARGSAAGLLPPLSPAACGAFFRTLASGVGAGSRIVVTAWRDGVIVGAAWAGTDLPQDQAHRAELQALLLHPACPEREAGAAVLAGLEQHIRQSSRCLLTLTARVGDAAERLCRTVGWEEAGRVPAMMRDADGTAHDGIILWKCVGTLPAAAPDDAAAAVSGPTAR